MFSRVKISTSLSDMGCESVLVALLNFDALADFGGVSAVWPWEFGALVLFVAFVALGENCCGSCGLPRVKSRIFEITVGWTLYALGRRCRGGS